MKKYLTHLLAAALLIFASSTVNASIVTFDAVGSPDVTGYVQFDASFNGGTFQSIPNTDITGLSLIVDGFTFTFADVNTAGLTWFNSSGAIPLIVNGGGYLANNGAQSIEFIPGGDGDADLGRYAGGQYSTFAVRWTSVPEPSALLLLGSGLVGLVSYHRRKRMKQAA